MPTTTPQHGRAVRAREKWSKYDVESCRTLVVDLADIAGVEPALGVDGLFGLLLVVPEDANRAQHRITSECTELASNKH